MGKNTFIGMPKGIFKGMRGKLGDFINPVVTSFTVPLSSLSYTISILAFTATDNVGITGYLITESNIPPLPSDPGWNVLPPATYTVATEGAKTLYPWAKDAAGNVSAVYGTPGSVFVSVWYGPTWAISGDAASAVNTPTLGGELIVNGGFDTDTVWVKGTGWTIGGGVASKAAGALTSITQAALITNQWYRSSLDYNFTGSGIAALFGGFISVALLGSAIGKIISGLCITNSNAGISTNGSGVTGALDNVSYKAIATSGIIASRLFTSSDGTASAKISATPNGTQAGIILNLDSNTSPANFVLAFHDGANVRMYKCVAGVYTQLINVATTFVNAATLSIVKSGTSYSVFYNGVQRGTTQTISDAGIISNTRHGLFSTYSGNTLTDWSFA